MIQQKEIENQGGNFQKQSETADFAASATTMANSTNVRVL